jgi:hypothetical protein
MNRELFGLGVIVFYLLVVLLLIQLKSILKIRGKNNFKYNIKLYLK